MLKQELQELDSLTPTRPFSRRDFVATTMGSGFAAAVLPVSAQTITTDMAGLVAGRIAVQSGDTTVPAYMAKPGDPGRWPVVLVISEIFGVHDHIADVARRFAKAGYMAIAPEMFVRQGDAKAYTANTPRHPVDRADALNAPVLGLYGEKDGGIPLDTVDKMKAALAQAGAAGRAAAKKSQFVVYPDAPHAFHADYRPSYRKEAAEDGWKRCLAWFKANGVA